MGISFVWQPVTVRFLYLENIFFFLCFDVGGQIKICTPKVRMENTVEK